MPTLPSQHGRGCVSRGTTAKPRQTKYSWSYAFKRFGLLFLCLGSSIIVANCGGGTQVAADGGTPQITDPDDPEYIPTEVDFLDLSAFLGSNPQWSSIGQIGLNIGNTSNDDISALRLSGAGNQQLKIEVLARATPGVLTTSGSNLAEETLGYQIGQRFADKRITSLTATKDGAEWAVGIYYFQGLLGLASKNQLKTATSSGIDDAIDGLLMVTGNEYNWQAGEITDGTTYTFGGKDKTFAKGYMSQGSDPFIHSNPSAYDSVWFNMKLTFDSNLISGYAGKLEITDWSISDTINRSTSNNYLPKPVLIKLPDNKLVMADTVFSNSNYIHKNFISFTDPGVGGATAPFGRTATVTARVYGRTLDVAVLAGTYVFSRITPNLGSVVDSYWGIFILQQ